MYKVKDVADIAGVTVRTLHYYDKIGLLTPKKAAATNYRLYSDGDLVKLQQILFFKELDFPLKKIKEVLDNPRFDRKKALHAHKRLLLEKKERLERIIRSVDTTLKAMEGEMKMANKEMFEPFDMKKIEAHQKKYAAEAKEKYGHTEAYAESMKKTATYKEEDWRRIHEQQEALYRRLVALMNKGIESPDVQKVAGDMRRFITENFYECTPDIFRGLGQLYVSDPRFTKNIDRYRPGLAQFLSDAIRVYSDNLNA